MKQNTTYTCKYNPVCESYKLSFKICHKNSFVLQRQKQKVITAFTNNLCTWRILKSISQKQSHFDILNTY